MDTMTRAAAARAAGSARRLALPMTGLMFLLPQTVILTLGLRPTENLRGSCPLIDGACHSFWEHHQPFRDPGPLWAADVAW